ncbi:Acyl carrier protein mitochondrial [Taenia solium]|eukprot:TsM_000151700 transcript=TsM_000151700 gene=TsM_000151700
MSRCLMSICGVLRNAAVARNMEKFSPMIIRPYISRTQKPAHPSISSLQTRSFSHGPPLSKPMIEDRVMLVLQLYDKIDPNKLTLKSDLVKDFGLDSLDMVEVNVAMEEEFTFDIPSADAQRLRTPFDIIQYICDKHDIYE